MTKRHPAGLRRCLVIYNPSAGSILDRDLWLGTIVDKLCTRHNCLVSVRATTSSINAANILKDFDQTVDLVIAAGGDGTIRLVLGALSELGSKIPVGIIPFGTGNQLARNLGIYQENPLVDPLQHALDIIFSGRIRSIDMGKMNGHYFCVAIGAGPLSDAVLAPSQEEKANWGMLAYLGSMLQNLSATPGSFRITADKDTFDVKAAGLFVSNVGSFGMTTISDTAELDDGMLDLCIIALADFSDYIKLGFQFATVIPGLEAPYYVRKVKTIKIESLSGQVQANVDGDACGFTPMEISVIPGAVNLLCPN